MKKVLHLALGTKHSHWECIYENAKTTWMACSPPNIKTIFMFGGENKIFWDGDNSFYVDRADNHSTQVLLYKTIKAFEWFYESEYDYIYRTNCTGYFDLKLVSEYLENKPTTNFYSGFIGNFTSSQYASYCGLIGNFDSFQYASGASFFLSKNLVKQIIDNQDLLFGYNYPSWMDDVCIGHFLNQELGINIDDDITSNNLRKRVTPENIDDDLDMSFFHYYVDPRNSNVKNLGDSYVRLINKIHQLKNL